MKDFQYTYVDHNCMLRVNPLTREERSQILSACRIMGLRKSEFYRRAIVEKAQTVITSNNSNSDRAPSPHAQSCSGDARFLHGGKE